MTENIQVQMLDFEFENESKTINIKLMDSVTLRVTAKRNEWSNKVTFTLMLLSNENELALGSPVYLLLEELNKMANSRSVACRTLTTQINTWLASKQQPQVDRKSIASRFLICNGIIFRNFQAGELKATLVNRLGKEISENNMETHVDSDGDLAYPTDAIDFLDIKMIENNHFGEELTLETIIKHIPDGEGGIQQHNLYFQYHKDIDKFEFTTETDMLIRSFSPKEYPTFSKTAILQLLSDEKKTFRQFAGIKIPTLRNRTELKRKRFRERLWRIIRKTVKEFIYFEDNTMFDLVVAYVLLTYFYDVFDTTPYLLLWGDKSSGKSQLAELIECLGYRPVSTVGSSGAYLFRTIDGTLGVMIVDEAQSLLNDPNKKEVRDILKAGYQKGRTVGRMVGERSSRAIEYGVFCPKIIVSTEVPEDALTDRVIPFVMKKPPHIMHFEAPKKRIPSTNLIRDYLLTLRMIHIKEIDSIRLENEYPNLFINRDRQHALPILTVAHFFYPDMVPILAKTLRVTMNKREEFTVGDTLTMLLDFMVLNELYGLLEVSEITDLFNEEVFGKDWKLQNLRRAYDPASIGRMLTKLGFPKKRSRTRQYEISKKRIVLAYASRSYDASDIYGRKFCLEIMSASTLDEYKLTGLNLKPFSKTDVEGMRRERAKDVSAFHTEKEQELIKQEIEYDDSIEETMFSKIKGVTEEEEGWYSDQIDQLATIADQMAEETPDDSQDPNGDDMNPEIISAFDNDEEIEAEFDDDQD